MTGRYPFVDVVNIASVVVMSRTPCAGSEAVILGPQSQTYSELADLDNHDAVLAEWELTLDDATRERLRAQGYRLGGDAA